MSGLEQYEEVVLLRAQIIELRDLFKSSSDALWSSYSDQKKRIEELEDQIAAIRAKVAEQVDNEELWQPGQSVDLRDHLRELHRIIEAQS